MRLIITNSLIVLFAAVSSPVHSNVLMPWSFDRPERESQVTIIAETAQNNKKYAKPKDVVEFKVLLTLKGRTRPTVVVARSTAIQEERLTCCTGPGRYILFLRRGRNGSYESVHGRYGVVQLAEELQENPANPGQLRIPER